MAKFNTVTGFGYFLDSNGKRKVKTVIPPGDHNLTPGFTFVEVADQAALDSVVLEPDPIPQVELDERKIQNEIHNKQREDAITSLKGKGELPSNFVDKKPKR